MRDSWDRRIRRANTLLKQPTPAKDLLVFYGQVLSAQKAIYDSLRGRAAWQPSGSLDRDLPAIRTTVPLLTGPVIDYGPAPLAEVGKALLGAGSAELDEILLQQWQEPSDMEFFPKAFLQPYLGLLIERGVRPTGRFFSDSERRCPYCGGRPQLTFLEATEGEGGGRSLVCSDCLSAWPFRRVVCAACGEEDPPKLGYYQSPQYDYIRVESCESCKFYIKGIDLTRLGLAVPIVDEVAAAALDLWAREQGLTKIELNLVGL
jgi:formate dehydrogenase maturation protein FdhE